MSNGVKYTRDLEGDDDYYMDKMKEILDAEPNTGPPSHPAKLLDHMYIGNQDNAEDYDLLPAIGITHVLNVAGTRTFDLTKSRYPPKLGITGFLMMPAEDYEEFDIMQYFPDAITFLDRTKAAGGRALVHCNLGVNRSGAIVAMYMMVHQRKPLLKVISELKDRRSVVLCNVGFRHQLLKYARARGLLDPVEEPPKKDKKQVENGVAKEDAPTTNGFDSSKWDWNGNGSTWKDTKNGDDTASYFRNTDTSYTSDDRPSTSDYYNTSSTTYRSSSRKIDDLVSDDDLDDEISRSMSTTALKAKLAVAKSRLPMSNGASSNLTNGYADSTLSPSSYQLPYSPLASGSAGSSPYITPSPSVYSPSVTSLVSDSISPLALHSSLITREVSPVYVPSLTSDTTGIYSTNKYLNGLLDREIVSPVSDTYRITSRSYLDSGGSSDISSDISSITGSSLYDGSNLPDSYLPAYREKSLPLSVSTVPSVDILLPEITTPSVHPLLAKPTKSYSTSNSDSFKTTVKPKSYYYRNATASKIPRRTYVDELSEIDAISDAYRAHVGLESKSSLPSYSSEYSGRKYGNDYNSVFDSVSDYIPETSYYSRPSLSTRSSYRSSVPRDYPSQSSSSYSRSSSVSRSSSRPTGGSVYGGSSYRPCYGPKAGYIGDLDADIAAFNDATLGMMSSGGSGLGSVRTRVVPPARSSYGYDDLSLYGW